MNKEEIDIKNLDHLGLVAGIIDDLEIENIVDSLIEQDKREKVSAGKIVKAIILNGLGFISRPLYLFPQFFQDKPVEKLLGEGIKAEEINDDKIGRVMDKLHELSLESLWVKIGINTMNKFEINTKHSHLDSSSISVEGKYNSQNESSENILKITQGYSRDHRPDLPQFMIDLMCSSDGDIPLFMRIGNGNESDKTIFPQVIKTYQETFKLSTIFVADSALYTAKNIHDMKELSWITRVPFTIKRTQEIVKKEEEEWEESEKKGYKYREKRINYHGIEQRWLIVESEKRKESDLLKLREKVSKEETKIEKLIKKLIKKKWQKKEELEKEIKTENKKLKYHQFTEIEVREEINKEKESVYSVQLKCVKEEEIIKEEERKSGKFILATNILNKEELSSEEILLEYKNQQCCERGFRFLKDPLFLTSSVYVKNPERVEVMGMLMGLCLLVYTVGQRMLRKEIEKRQIGIRNQVNKLTNNPTMKWIFQSFQGIHYVLIDGKECISNLKEERKEILSYFSPNCQKYY